MAEIRVTPRYSPTKEHAELHARVLGVVAGHQFALGLRQVEGQPLGLGEAGDQEDDQARELRNAEPEPSLGFDDVAAG